MLAGTSSAFVDICQGEVEGERGESGECELSAMASSSANVLILLLSVAALESRAGQSRCLLAAGSAVIELSSAYHLPEIAAVPVSFSASAAAAALHATHLFVC